MKKLILMGLTVVTLSQHLWAQESDAVNSENFPNEVQPTESRPVTNYIFGISTVNWNDTLKIQDGVNIVRDSANYLGTSFSYQKEINFPTWGWSTGFFFATGKAVGGGNSTLINYSKNKIAFLLFGFYPRMFYRISSRINTGISIRAFYRNIDWPRDTTTQTIDAGRNINLSTLVDLNIRLNPKWELNTAMGPLNEGATLWQVGAYYRF